MRPAELIAAWRQQEARGDLEITGDPDGHLWHFRDHDGEFFAIFSDDPDCTVVNVVSVFESK